MKTEEQLDQAIAQLKREIKPPRDLWAAIEPELAEREQPAVRWYRSINAGRWAAVLVVALTGVLWWSQLNLPQTGDVVPDTQFAGTDQNMNESELTADVMIMASFEQIKAQQLSEMDYVSPDAGDWQYQLAVWDQAISQVRGALEYYPEEPFLLAQMQGLYQQQIGYLQTISALGN